LRNGMAFLSVSQRCDGAIRAGRSRRIFQEQGGPVGLSGRREPGARSGERKD
jgi:hypothetical protein